MASLDGYIEDKAGEFGWAAPDEEVLAFINDLERPIGTYLYGRRMYDTMLYWETANNPGDPPSRSRDFGEIWLLCPIIVGGGKPALPEDVRVQLELLGERRFRGGVVHLHYALARGGQAAGQPSA